MATSPPRLGFKSHEAASRYYSTAKEDLVCCDYCEDWSVPKENGGTIVAIELDAIDKDGRTTECATWCRSCEKWRGISETDLSLEASR